MKSASDTLKTFLASNRQFVKAELYTFTIPGGTVLRYSDSGRVENYGGNSYVAGPRINRTGLSQKVGLEVSSATITIAADDRHQVNSVNLLTFIRNRGLDSALITITRVYAADWSSSWVGGVTMFLGRVSEITESGNAMAKVLINSGLEVLDASMPADVYQASCLNTLFDTNCGANRTSFQATGTVTSGSIAANAFPTSISAAAAYYALGTLLFTSGANSGQRRTVKTQDASGNLTFVAPFPSKPAAGDAFTIWPGCDLSQARCTSFFNNLGRFRGQPYIPIPETIMGGVAGANNAAASGSTSGVPGGPVGIGGGRRGFGELP